MRVVILQGLPGSGKTTYIRRQAESGEVASVSADDYFLDGKGVYRFDPSLLPAAHSACRKAFHQLCDKYRMQDITLFVDNTNTTVSEVSPYYCMAIDAKAESVEILYVPCTPEVAAARNTHGVPLAGCQNMQARLDVFEQRMRAEAPWWRRRTIDNNQQEVR